MEAIRAAVIKSGKIRAGLYDTVYSTESAKLLRMAKDDKAEEAKAMAREAAEEAFFKDAYFPIFTTSDDGKLSVTIKAKTKAIFKKKKDVGDETDDSEMQKVDKFDFVDADKLSHEEIERAMANVPEHRMREVKIHDARARKEAIGADGVHGKLGAP